MSQSTTVAAPVSIISPTHAIGVAMVISQAILALLLLAGVGTTDALTALLGNAGATVLVPILMLLSSCGALLAIISVAWVSRYESSTLLRASLHMEGVCKTLLAAMTLLYAYAITDFYGATNVPNLSVYVWATGIGFAARSIQIFQDLRSLARAQKTGMAANPPPLGQTEQG